MTTEVAQKASMDEATRYLVSKYSPKGNRAGWLMMSSILVEAWDLYSIAFVLVFVKQQFNPDPCCSAWPRRAHRAARCSAR